MLWISGGTSQYHIRKAVLKNGMRGVSIRGIYVFDYFCRLRGHEPKVKDGDLVSALGMHVKLFPWTGSSVEND
jgi:hypothetical protein